MREAYRKRPATQTDVSPEVRSRQGNRLETSGLSPSFPKSSQRFSLRTRPPARSVRSFPSLI